MNKGSKMLNKLFTITITSLSVFIISGCSKDPEPNSIAAVTQQSVKEFGCKQEGVDAPQWTCIPIVDGYYAGVGVAPKSAAGMGHMRRIALANGRSDLAQQIQSQVKDKVETYTGTTGNGNAETVDIVTTAVSKQLAKVDLQGSKGIDTWDAPSGTLYMLVTVPASSINQEVKNSIKTSFKSDDASWQQFKSQQALESLEKEFPTD